MSKKQNGSIKRSKLGNDLTVRSPATVCDMTSPTRETQKKSKKFFAKLGQMGESRHKFMTDAMLLREVSKSVLRFWSHSLPQNALKKFFARHFIR